MKAFWPTPDAIKSMPEIAHGLNSTEKIVFSNTITEPGWNNVRIISGNIAEEVKKLKQTSAKNLTILGSGTILSQLTDAGLIDKYEIMLSPIALGSGVPIFKGIKNYFDLELTSVQTFKSGTLLLTYKPLNK
jgi:dihydrofolate reductase